MFYLTDKLPLVLRYLLVTRISQLETLPVLSKKKRRPLTKSPRMLLMRIAYFRSADTVIVGSVAILPASIGAPVMP